MIDFVFVTYLSLLGAMIGLAVWLDLRRRRRRRRHDAASTRSS